MEESVRQLGWHYTKLKTHDGGVVTMRRKQVINLYIHCNVNFILCEVVQCSKGLGSAGNILHTSILQVVETNTTIATSKKNCHGY